MRNVRMIRTEPDLMWIPVEKAVYCENCETVSSSSGRRCGLCGSEHIVPIDRVDAGAMGPKPDTRRHIGSLAIRLSEPSL